jgi:hypothetical protein
MRKASLKRASVSAAPAAVTNQKAAPRRRHKTGDRTLSPVVAKHRQLWIPKQGSLPGPFLRLLHREGDEQERKDRRNHGDPEDRAEVVVPREHQGHRDERSGERADGVERLA